MPLNSSALTFSFRIRAVLVAIFSVAVCAFSPSASAQFFKEKPADGSAAVVTTPRVRAELLVLAPQGVGPGMPLRAGLRITHQPHWHTYWKNPGDSGLATQLDWNLPAGITPGAIDWPIPQTLRVGPLANYGYEGTVLLPVTLKVGPDFHPPANAGGTITLRLHAQWLVCREECIPEQGDFSLDVPVQGSTALESAAFDAADAAQPQPLPAGASAQIAVQNDHLALAVRGLPDSVQGKTLELYPEINAITQPAAPLQQSWSGDEWRASAVLSASRSEAPATLPLVLVATAADGSRSGWRVQAPVSGTWPPVAAPAVVPASLTAALSANAAGAATSAPTASRAKSPLDAGAAQAATATPTPAAPGLLVAALAAALLGGLLLNLMPCVFPILAVKVLGFARHSSDRRALRIGGLAYTAGVVLSFVALGALVLALRAGGAQLGWGFQLQNPAVVAALAALFTLLGLNLAGVFEFGMFAPRGLAGAALRHPVADAFLSGVLVVAIASPCTAPFMGASLGLAMGLPSTQALPVFAALGLGMALPYLAASWLPAAARLLPRPGAWMQIFRRAMAFPMFATVAWLVWVIGQQTGINGAAALLLLLIALAALAAAFALHGKARIWLGAAAVVGAIALAIVLGPVVVRQIPLTTSSADSEGHPISADGWQPWSQARTEALLAEGRPVFIDFTAAWCVTCQVNERTTLARTDVRAAFAGHKVALLRADWTRQDPEVTRALRALGRSGVPVYVLLAPGKPPIVLSELISGTEVLDALSRI
jgi:thiol:disulfide interchange protein